MKRVYAIGWLLPLLLLPLPAMAQLPGVEALRMIPGDDGSQSYSVTIQILAIMTALTLLPSMLIMLTSFTRIIVVLAILRQALGLQQTPSNQILIGLTLFLTFFIMTPVWERINAEALQPYIAEEVSPLEAVQLARAPLQEFMLAQTREVDLDMFARIGGYDVIESPEDVPFVVLVPAFVTSELKTAFQIGFMLFIPFLILDMVVASILMAMGMMMLSPIIISLPFKIMLFVLVDGWTLVMGTLAASYGY
ncbi:flagellar type III secretion system pore protein FliP [Marinospirillum alkaliphilum]|uniref:Flagellar biosynthetic protein FliP n=1 Tax=Marinospirillum alkaliphilum DSM 21637 TaxID=1122209 RepID=A0A1K1VBB5_9GAMM|nr:flagellar type III secretion system pore protein FliP [Marinospirillum alkaliphilum]SFX22367.1 flagellar biosynthetic protein FliP [Marinospirillum alkaliphilum DSM 21637]